MGSRCRASSECPVEFTAEKDKCPLEATCSDTGEEGGCTACVARKDCAFIPSISKCVPSSKPFSYNHLPYIWGEVDKCPEVCGKHESCKECSSDKRCGWCPLSGCHPLGRSKSPQTSGPDYLSTGVRCSPFVDSYSRLACKAAEKAKADAEGGGGGSFWAALGWTFFALILLALVGFGLWWFFFRYRPSRGHAPPTVPLLDNWPRAKGKNE